MLLKNSARFTFLKVMQPQFKGEVGQFTTCWCQSSCGRCAQLQKFVTIGCFLSPSLARQKDVFKESYT